MAGANILYTPEGRIVCPACFAKAPPVADVGRAPWRTFAIAGGVVGAIPFAVNVSTSSSRMVNGHVTAFVYRDWIAVACGVVAIVLGGIAVGAARKEQLQRALAFAAGIGVMLLGGVQIARGFGVFEAPGSSSSSSSMTYETTTPGIPEPPPADPDDPTTCPDAHACFQLGLALEKAEPAKATVAYERACQFGSNGGCLNAGIDYREREPKDLAKSARLFQHGCDLQQYGACNELGFALRHGKGIEKDAAAAAKAFGKACSGGELLGCTNLAYLYEFGEGVDQDVDKAISMLAEICEGSEAVDTAPACNEAGTLIYKGGKNADLRRAASLMKLACERSANECKNYGIVLQQGAGVKEDNVTARQVMERGCGGGEAEACHSLGYMRDNGLGGPVDREGALAAFKQGCDGGFQKSCGAVEEMTNEAKAPAKAPATKKKHR